MDNLFALRQKYKGKNNDVMQIIVKLLLISSYGEKIRKDFGESFACKSEAWMMTDYEEGVKGYWRISHANYIVKMIDHKGLEDELKKLNTMPFHLEVFVLSNSERIMSKVIHAIGGLAIGLYIEKKTLG